MIQNCIHINTVLHSNLTKLLVRNRQMAINAHETWPPESLSVHRQYIMGCATLEPHEEVQQRLQSLLGRIS